MDMVSLHSFGYGNAGFNVCPVPVKKQAETDNEILSGKNGISDADCFKELCKKFPGASFAVEDISLECTDKGWLPERFLGNSKLQNFSNLETLSIAFDKKIFEKAANDPVFMECLVKFTENLDEQWAFFKERCLSDGMKYMHVDAFLEADGTIGYNTIEYKAPFRLFDLHFSHENNLSGYQDDGIAKRILDEYEKQKLEGLFAMMDKIHEDSKKLNKQIKREKYHEKLEMEKYKKTFIFQDFKNRKLCS